MRKVIFYFFVIVLLSCEFYKDQGKLTWILVNNNLTISHVQESTLEFCKYNCVQLEFRLTNTTNQNLILYNFNRFFNFPEFNEGDYCDTLFLPADSYVYIYQANGERILPLGGIPDSINWKPSAILEKQIEESDSWFKTSKQIIKKGETVDFTKEVNLKNYNLRSPGTYKLNLMYYQYDVLKEISQKELEDDIRENDASLFKGCLVSNTIYLRVE